MFDCYTSKELMNIVDKIWKRTRLEMGMFDWPTFVAVFPQRAKVFKSINSELQRRGQKDK